MNHLNEHPIFEVLANTPADLFPVELDDKELERVMDQDNSILGVRIVAVSDPFLPAPKAITGTITARVRTLVSDTEGCVLQNEFRDRIVDHPAYELVGNEIREAYQNGTMFKLFDTLEGIGVIVGYDKASNKVSLGLNAMKMNMGVREHKRMFSSNNQRSIDYVNNEGGVLGPVRSKEAPITESAGMSTTFYITFDV